MRPPLSHSELLYGVLIIQAVKFDLTLSLRHKNFLFSIKGSKLQWLNVCIFTLTIISNNPFSYLQLPAYGVITIYLLSMFRELTLHTIFPSWPAIIDRCFLRSPQVIEGD